MMKRFLALLILPLMACCKGGGNGDPSEGPVTPDPPTPVEVTGITGSFIQHWYVKSWSSTEWTAEMKVLSEAGMEYLVFTPLKEDDAEPDYAALEKCLQSAAAAGIKVFVGTNFHKDWWNAGITAAWLNARMTEGVEIAREVYRRFGSSYTKSLYGWYWDWEVDNASWNSRQQMLTDAMNITLDGLTGIDAAMPLLFCPFMNPVQGTAKQYGDFWKAVFPALHFRKGDIFAPQDCVGAAGMPVTTVKSWFYQFSEAVKTVEGLQLWADIELFEQFNYHGEAKFTTAPFGRMVKQIDAVKPFVDRIICFAYSHYYSPALVREEYHAAYKTYIKSGTEPTVGKPGKVNSATKEVGTGVALSWTKPTRTDVDGFAIYKNGKLLIKLQVREGLYPLYFFDYEGKASDSYYITVYNLNGDESEKVSF